MSNVNQGLERIGRGYPFLLAEHVFLIIEFSTYTSFPPVFFSVLYVLLFLENTINEW